MVQTTVTDPDNLPSHLLADEKYVHLNGQKAYILAFGHPAAYPTNNMIDRRMDLLARWLFSARFFHGHCLGAKVDTSLGLAS